MSAVSAAGGSCPETPSAASHTESCQEQILKLTLQQRSCSIITNVCLNIKDVFWREGGPLNCKLHWYLKFLITFSYSLTHNRWVHFIY